MEVRVHALGDKLTDVNNRSLAIRENLRAHIQDERPGLKFWVPIFLAVFGAAAGWVYTLAEKPDRQEMETMIQDHSPYRKDQASIQRVVERYDDDMANIREGLSDIKLEQRHILVKLDQYLGRGNGRAPARNNDKE